MSLFHMVTCHKLPLPYHSRVVLEVYTQDSRVFKTHSYRIFMAFDNLVKTVKFHIQEEKYPFSLFIFIFYSSVNASTLCSFIPPNLTSQTTRASFRL